MRNDHFDYEREYDDRRQGPSAEAVIFSIILGVVLVLMMIAGGRLPDRLVWEIMVR